MTKPAPRAVFLYARMLYLNPHQSALIEFLRQEAAGWDFIDVSERLAAGVSIAALAQRLRGQDLLIIHSSLFSMAHAAASDVGALYARSRARPEQYREFLHYAYAAKAPRILMADTIDLHGDFNALDLRPAAFDALISFYYPHRFTARADVPPALFESWMATSAAPEEQYRKLMAIPVQIEMAFCLHPDEFAEAPSAKLLRCTVPGTGYRRRQIAARTLPSHAMLPYRGISLIRMAAGKASALSGSARPTRFGIAFAQTAYLWLIRRSHMAYAEGSGYDYAVRKFIEIPAQRTLLLATPHPGMSDRGFVDGVTHIDCAPEDVGAISRRLDPTSAPVRQMIEAGYRVTFEKHHARVRAQQITDAIARFAAGRLKHAAFEGGEFVCRES